MLDPRTVFLVVGEKVVYLWVGASCHPSYQQLYVECAKKTHRQLIQFEGAPLLVDTVFQAHEPSDFWHNLDIPPPKKNSESRPPALPDSARLTDSEVYRVNKNWNNWFLNLDEEYKIRSARSQKSVLVYAERTELVGKPALFVYPYYLEPLYVLDLDDLTEEAFAILCDKQERQCFIWKGSLFEEQEEESGTLNLQEFVHLTVESFFETSDAVELDYVFEQSGEESDRFLNYFS
jgi:hypothetical protein